MSTSFRSGFILEDLPESQRWLTRALNEAFPGIEIATAANLAEGHALLDAGLRPDIALIDLGLPDGSGVSLIEAISRAAPATLCVVASIYDDDSHIFPALRAGAGGYLLKDQPIAVIVQALRGIATGNPPLSPAIARRMLGFFQPAEAKAPEHPYALTRRETEVLRYLAKGMTQSDCARLMGISTHTAVGYVKDIYRKLNVSSRAEATLLARDLGLV